MQVFGNTIVKHSKRPPMYLKMELTDSDIAIRKFINNQHSDVYHQLFAFLVLTQTVARQTATNKHIVNGVYRHAVSLDCDVRHIQSD